MVIFFCATFRVFCMADIPTMYQKRSTEITIVSAIIRDEVKKLPIASGVSGTGSKAGELIAIKD